MRQEEFQFSRFQSSSTLCFNMKNSNNRNEKDLAESVVCREITQEIVRFGVSQDQLRKIIKLLAFELDDNSMMKEICNAIEGSNKTKLTF